MDVVVVTEDALGEALLLRIVQSTPPLRIYRSIVAGGVSAVRSRMGALQNASKHLPQIVLIDLDNGGCAPSLMARWKFIPGSFPHLLFRVAVTEVESWLLADSKGISEYLGIPQVKVPVAPESVADPKRTLVNLARKSRGRRLRDEIAPAQGSGASVGPLYNQHMTAFVREKWNVDRARQCAPSLDRAFQRIQSLGDWMSRQM